MSQRALTKGVLWPVPPEACHGTNRATSGNQPKHTHGGAALLVSRKVHTEEERLCAIVPNGLADEPVVRLALHTVRPRRTRGTRQTRRP